MFRHGQFARVVKGVDLRSTAGNCAWVRTPQLTFRMLGVFMALTWMRKEERCKDPHRGKTAEILTTIPNLLQRFQHPATTSVFGLRP